MDESTAKKLEEVLDKDALDEFKIFLAEKNTPPLTELTSHGGEYLVNFRTNQYLDQYNPDTIPFSTYEKMRNDPQIALGLSVIKLPILALSWNVQCTDPKIAAFVKHSLEPIWRRLLKSTLTAIDFGFACHEKVWEYRSKYIVETIENGKKETHFSGPAYIYKKIKPHHPSAVTIRTDNLGNFAGITHDSDDRIVQLNDQKSFLYVHDEEFGNMYGKSRLKAAYNVWYWKMLVYQFMLRYLERKGTPATIVQAPPGTIKMKDPTTGRVTEIDQMQEALKVGKSLLANAVAVIPYTESSKGHPQWDIKYLGDDKRAEQFITVINHLDAKALRALFIPERSVTQESSTGSNAMAATHSSVFMMSTEGTVSEIEAAFNRYIIPQMVDYNFGANKPEASIHFDKLRWDKREHYKDLLTTMLTNIDKYIEDGGDTNGMSIIPDMQKMGEVLEVPMRTAKLKNVQLEVAKQRVTTGGKVAPGDKDKKGNEKKKTASKAASKAKVYTIQKRTAPKLSEDDSEEILVLVPTDIEIELEEGEEGETE